jgi:L-fucose mutarotase
MLKGVHPVLTADVLHTLAAMGHGDVVAIVDANFPAASVGRVGRERRIGRALSLPSVVDIQSVKGGGASLRQFERRLL